MSASDWYQRLSTGEDLPATWSSVMAVTTALMRYSVPETTIQALLLEPSNEGARYINFDSTGRQRPQSTRTRFVNNAIAKARRLVATSTPIRDKGEVITAIQDVIRAADAVPERWTGKAGATDRALLVAACEIAERFGRFEFYATFRTLADEAGIASVGTVSASLARLNDWVRVVELGRGKRATTLCLRNPTEPSVSLKDTSMGSGDYRNITHDLWRHEGLGKSAGKAHGLLSDEPQSTAAIAAALSISERGARTHLAILQSWHLADRVLDGWVRGDADLNLLAVEIGASAGAERQRERHRRHVQARRQTLERNAHAVTRRNSTEHEDVAQLASASEITATPPSRDVTSWWETWWGSLNRREIARAA